MVHHVVDLISSVGYSFFIELQPLMKEYITDLFRSTNMVHH